MEGINIEVLEKKMKALGVDQKVIEETLDQYLQERYELRKEAEGAFHTWASTGNVTNIKYAFVQGYTRGYAASMSNALMIAALGGKIVNDKSDEVVVKI